MVSNPLATKYGFLGNMKFMGTSIDGLPFIASIIQLLVQDAGNGCAREPCSLVDGLLAPAPTELTWTSLP